MRKYDLEAEINGCLSYQERFNFDYFCNDFKPQSPDIYRLIIKNSNASEAKENFMKGLVNWNNAMNLNKFLAVAGVACEGSYGSNIAILYLNFNLFGKNRNYKISTVYEFLATLTFEYDFMQILSKNAVAVLYQQLDIDSIFFTNIADLHLYRGNKIIQTVCFEKINLEGLRAIICERLRLYNREYWDNILNLMGTIKLSFEGFPVLTCHSYLQKGDKNDLQFRLAELWRSVKHHIFIDSYETDDDPISLIGGEFLNGGMLVGNIEESIGKP